ncbi:MAG: peptidylprolyl isomerase [Clostridia bacterium]|nr:peptidylprolyl isomerase [Clostridia bacterium]
MKKTQIFWIIAIAFLSVTILALVIGYITKATEVIKNPVVTMEIADYGTIKVELYPDMAPNTVKHFIKKIQEGFYDGLTFHRTIPDFMIQGGKNEKSEDTYTIKGEFLANAFKDNKLKHERGVISMARIDYSQFGSGLESYSYNSASTEFFIMTKDTSSLDGYYAAFGKVIEGMEVVDAIANVEVVYRSSELGEGETAPTDATGQTIASDKPVNEPVITKMTVDTFGVNYGNFEKYSYE